VDQADVARFHRQVRRVLAVLVARGAVRVTRGKCVLEVRPQTRWDKGSAVAWLDRRCDTRGRVLYLGDDRTDEDAFRAANRLGGISIAVGTRPGRTAARWWLPGPRDVGKLLSLILDVRCRKRSKR
jgi:trehalose-phosphatase